MDLAKTLSNAPGNVIDGGINFIGRGVSWTIGGITNWTLGSIGKVLAGTGKMAGKGVASIPFILGPK